MSGPFTLTFLSVWSQTVEYVSFLIVTYSIQSDRFLLQCLCKSDYNCNYCYYCYYCYYYYCNIIALIRLE